MSFCPSAIATAAVFTALVVNDLINKNYTPIVLHVFGGIFVVLGITALCQRIGDYAGWLLLLIPIFIILIGFFLEWYSSYPNKKVDMGPSSGPCLMPCQACGYCKPCRCSRQRNCRTSTTSTMDTQAPTIGADLPPNPQVSTLGIKKC